MRVPALVRAFVVAFSVVVTVGLPVGAEPPVCAPAPRQALELHVMRLIPTRELSMGTLFGRHPLQGLHTPRGLTHLLEINEDLERDKPHVARTVCAHEMGHALGVDHIDDKACWMFPNCNADSPVITWPNAKELEITKRNSAGKVFKLIIDCPDDPAIARAARWAAETWNCALERDVILVQR